jgi:hypothetical protein
MHRQFHKVPESRTFNPMVDFVTVKVMDGYDVHDWLQLGALFHVKQRAGFS